MALSTDFELPIEQEPQFPDRCIVCGKESPDQNFRITSHRIGWWTVLLFAFGSPHTVRVPACTSCGWRMRLARWTNWLLSGVLFLVAGFILIPIIGPLVPPAIRKYAIVAGVIVCLTPLFLWELFFPPVFDITVTSKNVTYEFRDPAWALMFAVENDLADPGEVMRSIVRHSRESDEFALEVDEDEDS